MFDRPLSILAKIIATLSLLNVIILPQDITPDAGYIFNLNKSNIASLCDEERTRIEHELKFSIQKLKAKGLAALSPLRKITARDFNWPLRPAENLTDESYYVISGFVDHNENYPDQLLDYNGGTRTYDTESKYNHRGTDFATWPFSWYKMDNDQVAVVSMAPGTIVLKYDGNFDRSCAMSSDPWNAVFVLHDNGATAWYGHMKKNSLTTKNVGDSVETGEYLGVVGSSGSSTGPHLHLEIYDSENNLIDPWEGSANPTITSSWWVNQPPYYDSKILKLSTHSAWPVFPDCPQQEILNLKDEFTYGDTVFLVSFYRDIRKGQTASYKFISPENVIPASWDFSIPEDTSYLDYYTASWWGWWFIIPTNASLGTWEYSVFYENTLYRHYVTITDNPTSMKNSKNLPKDFYLSNNYPNPFNPTTTINYQIPLITAVSNSSQRVTIIVYDILGNHVKTIVDEIKTPGFYEVKFSAEDFSSGTYFYQLRSSGNIVTKKMTFLK